MVIALLVLIVLILLFGAAAVRGWLTNILVVALGLVALIAALLWVGSFFGDDGPKYVIYFVCAVGFVLAILAAIYQSNEKASEATPLPDRVQLTWAPDPLRLSSHAAWQRWGADITHSFGEEARTRAQRLYDAGDGAALDKFCREEWKRLRP